MAKRNLLAFDLGASNGRAILGSFDGERLEMEELHRFETPCIDLNGILYWDAPAIFTHMKGALAKFAALDQGPLQGLGIDTWGVDYGLLDKNGNLLGLPRCYRASTDQDVEAVHRIVPQRTLFQRTGINAMNYNTAYQLYRRKREGDGALSAAKTLLFMPDLLGYFLCGEQATEYTIATTSMLYDGSRRDWDRETLAQLGLPDVFTPIQQSGAQRGPLLPQICRETGVNPAMLCAVGGHDTASAVAAIPSQGNFAFCSSGTWSLFGVETDAPVLDEAAYVGGFSNEGTVQGGFRPLKSIMGLWLIQECRREWNREGMALSWDDIVAAAQTAEPFRSILDVDYGEFYGAGDMPGKIRAYCQRTGQPQPETVGQFARCIYESLALKYRYGVEILEAMKGQPLSALHIVGGGIQNKLLNQMAANATGRLVRTGPIEGAAMGNLLLQAVALGDLADITQVREVAARCVELTQYEPDQTAPWQDAYGRLLDLMQKEAETP